MRHEHLRSLGSTFRRAVASPALMLLALGMLPFAGAGCSLHSKPAAVAEVRGQPAKPEPYVLLDLSDRRVYVVDEANGGRKESFPVAIGRKQYPTPTGRFQINEMVENPDFLVFDFKNPAAKDKGRIPPGPKNPLGLRWIGFAFDHGWAIGFHGTHKTDVLGMAVSHGCVRMSNTDVVKLYERVKIGTTVVVEP
jgi:lipoprotein-anchoring transpeptidase ErfK/SrfK